MIPKSNFKLSCEFKSSHGVYQIHIYNKKEKIDCYGLVK